MAHPYFYEVVMSYQKIFALCLLSAVAFAGCAETSSQNECGNGVINTGEECDGTQLGNATCPNGQGTVKCSNTCKLDYTACSSQQKTCGNGSIDVGESCDGTVSATCPTGTTGNVLCTNCALDYSKCVASQNKPTCGNNQLDDGEECDGNLIPEAKRVCAEGNIGTPVCVNCSLVGCVPKPASICGNNTIETSEECDGTNLNNKSCADIKSGTTGTLKCTSCKYDVSECKTSEPPADDKCGNGTLDPNEDCDGTQFVDGKGECPSGTSGKVTCNACKADTTACKPASGTCGAGEDTCSASEENQSKCTQDGKFAKCTSGCWKVDDCSSKNMSCDESKGCVEADVEISKCENNIYTFGTTSDNTSVDCTPSGLLCDDKDGCVKNKAGITCEGTVLKLTGTSYSYNCANNKTSNVVLDRDKLGCAENIGCTDAFCNNSVPTYCSAGECVEEYDCSKFDAVCDMNADGYCKLTEETLEGKCFVDNGSNIYAFCDNNACIYDRCVGDCDDTGGCSEPIVEKCGNGTLDSDEDCDWQDNGEGGNLYIWSPAKTKGKPVTCNFYDANKVFVSGEPTCKNKKGVCKITVETCTEAVDSDFQNVKSWTFASLDDIKELTKSGEVTMKLRPITGANGNQDVSEYTTHAWRTGGWVKGTSADFNYYLWFHSGKKITDNTVRVIFDVKTTSKGPKYVMLQFFDGTTALGKSDAVSISDSYQTATFVYKSKSTITDFGFKLTAYNGGDGLLDIKDISVQSLNAI